MRDTVEIPTARAFTPLLQPCRYKGAHGGRSSGKSHFFAELMVEEALMDGTMRHMCVREHQISLRHSAKQLIEDKVRQMGVGQYFYPTNTHVGVAGGGVIIFQGLKNHTADSLKSFENFHRAWVEEGQRLSKTSWTKLYPTLRADNSEIWVSWNPDQPKDPVDDFFRSIHKRKDSICVEANYLDNPFVPKSSLDDAEYDKRRDVDRYKHVWLGGYNLKSDARVFKNWKIAEDLEAFETARKRAKRFYYGGDWGFANDPTVLIECFIEGRTLYVSREAYAIGCEIDHTPQLFDTITGARNWPIIGDSARPETISYMQRHGYPKLRKANKGPNSIEDGVEFLKSYDIIVHPDCVHTIDELMYYSFEVDEHTEEVLPKLEDKHNHVIDALRYSVESLRKPKVGLF